MIIYEPNPQKGSNIVCTLASKKYFQAKNIIVTHPRASNKFFLPVDIDFVFPEYCKIYLDIKDNHNRNRRKK